MIPNEKVDLPRQPQQQKQQHQQQQQLRQQPINEPQHLTNLSYYGDDDRTASSATASSSAAAAAKDAGDAVPYNNLNFIAKLGNLAYLWSLVSKTKFIVRKPSNANNRGIGSSGASGGWIPFFNFYYHPVLPIVVFTSIMTTLLLLAIVTRKQTLPYINVAMIGNSMQYYNDLPRFLGTSFASSPFEH